MKVTKDTLVCETGASALRRRASSPACPQRVPSARASLAGEARGSGTAGALDAPRAFVSASAPLRMRQKGWAAFVLLLASCCVLSAEGSRGRCDYGNIDRRGGRWVIPQKCTHLYLSLVGFAAAGSRQMGEALRNNTFVTEVDSSSCNIQTGAKYFETMLAENTALLRFNLGNNRIDDTGTEAIARGLAVNKGLKGLYMPMNRIGAAGAAALGQALKTNTVLETLNLDSNRLGDEGAIRLAEGLAENRGLRSLVIGGNDIGNEGAQALAAAVAKHPTLTVRRPHSPPCSLSSFRSSRLNLRDPLPSLRSI